MKRVIIISIFFICFGCAATQVALSKKDLKVENKMSDTIFLDIENQTERTVFVDLRNTSAHDIDILPLIIANLEAKGYSVIRDAKAAFYVLQANILFVGQADQTALEQSMAGGFGGTLAGAAVGGAVSGAGNGNILTGAAVGGLIGGATELISGSLVKDVTFTVITDIQVSERTKEKVEQTARADLESGSESGTSQESESVVSRKKHQARLSSNANQVNLTFDEALPLIEDGLVKAISGLF